MILVAIVAIAFFVVDGNSRKTVLVEFSSPVAWSNPESELNSENADYSVEFEIHYNEYSVTGLATGKFGPNSILATDVTPANLSAIDGFCARVAHRNRALPLLPATTIEDELAKYFDFVLVFADEDEWREYIRR